MKPAQALIAQRFMRRKLPAPAEIGEIIRR
jgi:hypothetical protein